MKPPGNADTLLGYGIGVNGMTLPISYTSKKLTDLQKTSAVVAQKIQRGPIFLVQSI